MLTMAGYAVRTAPSGERALQIMESTKMDLVVTDLRMSGMSGLDLLKKVKQQTPNVPVIILTGFGDLDSVIAAMRAGVADYLKKPFSVNEVLEVVKRELRKAQFIEPSAPPLEYVSAAPLEPGKRPPRLYIFSPGDLAGIEKTMAELRAQITAESVLLLEEAGYVISAKGTFSEAELPALTTLVVSSRLTTTELAKMLGEERSFALNYLEGQRVSVYTASLGEGLFLVLVVPKHVKQGAVWLYAKKAATDIEKIAERALEKMAKEKPPAQPEPPSREKLRQELSAQAENVFRQELAAKDKPAKPVQTLTFEEAMAQGLMGDLVDMMAKSSEQGTEQEALAALGELPSVEPAETFSFEEAMKQGLLGGVVASLDQPAAPEPTETLSFEEAMKQGLLGGVSQAVEQPSQPAGPEMDSAFKDQLAEGDEFLTFEEMLERGLLGDADSGLS
jgi:DNA-binding response OmpR family regulator